MFTASLRKNNSPKNCSNDKIIFTPAGIHMQNVVCTAANKPKPIPRSPPPPPPASDHQATNNPSRTREDSFSGSEQLNNSSEQLNNNSESGKSANDNQNLSHDNASTITSTTNHSDDKSDSNSTVNETTSDSEIRIKPSCTCAQCSHWTNSIELDFDQTKITTTRCHTNLVTPLLKTESSDDETTIKLMSLQYNSLSTMRFKSLNRLLVHSISIPEPVNLLSEAHFHKDIIMQLNQLNYETTKVIQSYAWPALTRQLNVCLIGDRQTGKTMSYLPFVGSFLLEKERYVDLLKYKQPVVVILCNSSVECEEIFDLASKVIKSARISLLTYPSVNIRRTDILITLPSILIDCMKRKMLNLKSLCCLVLESTDKLLINYQNEINQLLYVTNDMLAHRSYNNIVQLVITSEKWTINLKNLLKTLYCTPMICIQNYLEAAIYSKINFQIKLSSSDQKLSYLCDILKRKNNYLLHKTVVICDADEINEIKNRLLFRNIGYICILDDSSREDIIKAENEWNAKIAGDFRVLLCTDFIFGTMLKVTNANWLVHYSFPITWTRFVKRFLALLNSYQSPLSTEEIQTNCKTFLIIDEKCNEQLPKLLSLFKELDRDLVNHFKQYSEKLTNQFENEKILNNIPLCRLLKLFGKCSKNFCTSRHQLDNDLDINSNNLPRNGIIKFKITDIIDVNRYGIKLISHTINDNIENFDNQSKNTNIIETQKKNVENIEIGKFYLYFYTDKTKIIQTKCEIIEIDKEIITIKLFYNGWTIKTDKTKLYELNNNNNINLQIYLTNLIPPFKDENFCGKSLIQTKRLLNEFNYKSIIFTGNISLKLNNILWLDNVNQIITLNDLTDIVPFDLIKELKRLKIVETNTNQLKNLIKLCNECEINLPNINNSKKLVMKKIEIIKPQWAFLEDDDVVQEIIFCSAISPDEFYIRLRKFDGLLENLKKEIETSRKNPNFNKPIENVIIGKCYLALDSEELVYCRAIVLKLIETNKVLCLFVDYGDEDIININDLKYLSNDLLRKLPFQAIRCRLYGIKSIISNNNWNSTTATDILYKYAFQSDSNIYRQLFAKVCQVNDNNCNEEMIGFDKIYSILLKDGYNKENQVLINQLLIDCGTAQVNVDEEFNDFELIIDKFNDENIDEEISDNENNEKESFEESLKDMELFILDEDVFVNMFSNIIEAIPSTKCDSVPAIEYNSPKKIEETQTTSVGKEVVVENKPNVTGDVDDTPAGPLTFVPDIYWSQTPKDLKLKIQLTAIKNYQVNVRRGLRFVFNALIHPDKKYGFHFILYRKVENLRHRIIGTCIEVVLDKSLEEMWPRLGMIKKYMRNLHYEFSEAELEEPKRKFLQLDIPDDDDSESDDDDDDGFIMKAEYSDNDSNFEEEFEFSD